MRETLTVIGFLLIVAFAAAFSAPLYVDWNAWRQTIEAQLSQQVGAPVTISGPIRARILPQPWLSLEDVTIGVPNAPTKLVVERLDADLSLTALFGGQAVPSHAVFDRPTLTLVSDGERRIAPLGRGWLDGASGTFEIKGGTIRYSDKAAGHDLIITALDVTGDARAATTSIRGEGTMSIAGIPHTLRLATERSNPDALSIKLSVASVQPDFSVDLDGNFLLKDGQPSFSGSAVAAHTAPPSAKGKFATDQPWRLAGLVTLTPKVLSGDKIDIQFGPSDKVLKLVGKGTAQLEAGGKIDLRLTGTQLDIDRFAGTKADQLTPAAILSRLVEAAPSGLERPTHLNAAIGGIIMGGQALSDVRAEMVSSEEGWRVSTLAATLPGQTRLVLTGDKADSGSFIGQVDIQARQASLLMAWLQAAEPAPTPGGAGQLNLTAAVEAQPDAIQLSDLLLSIDQAKVSGRLGWSQTKGTKSGRIDADLTAQKLDLDTLPAMAALAPNSHITEADIRLKAQQMIWEGVEARSVSGHIKMGNGAVELDDVRIDDLGGTSLSASGRIEGIDETPRGTLRARIDGRDLLPLARALKRSALPAFVKDGFALRASSLSPANATLLLSFGDTKSLTIDGKLGGSVVSFGVELTGLLDRGQIEARLKLDSLDAGALLRQVGIPSPPDPVPGRASLSASLSGPLNAGRRWSLAFQGGGLDLESTGRMTGAIEAPALDGRMSLEIDDLQKGGEMLGVPFFGAEPGDGVQIESGLRTRGGRLVLDDLTGILLGSPISGAVSLLPGAPARIEGRLVFEKLDAARFGSLLAGIDLKRNDDDKAIWSSGVFGPSSTGGLSGALVLSAKSVTISPQIPNVSDLKGTLILEPGSTVIEGLQGRLANGKLTGSIRMLHTAPDVSVAGRLGIAGVSVAMPAVSAKLDAGLEFQGTGRSPSAVISSLTGSGTLTLAAPRFDRVSSSVLAEVLAVADADATSASLDMEPLIERSLAAGSLSTSDITAALQLSGGIIRLVNTTAKAQDTGVAVTGSVNLASLEARTELALILPTPADGFGGPPPAVLIAASGALDTLSRRIDASALKAWLIVRAADREAKKLDALEAEQIARERPGPNAPQPSNIPSVTPPPHATISAVSPSGDAEVPPLPPPSEIKPAPRIAPASGL